MRTSLVAAAVAAAFLAGSGFAQPAATSHNPAIKNGAPTHTSGAAAGRNSFTQDQAKGRLEKAGYTGVGKLAKDKNGVWRGTAMKDGAKVSVGVDYKGDVVTTR
ncbi:hypothetical protein [Sphingomonas morindae]|uniref:PepSY domain-containing protein n=1 Tax=Sphingomonas morindae TaxID=1541170 RepID=A0ABY4X991_9SPHN|nr:hypothetical protein [Sphingomonas morindae]USI73429.1 hypothetical protein LHA26_02820 [Sphingomonas morindae]